MAYFTENENRLGWLAFLLSFVVYSFTLCPTVFTGDSGELIASAYSLGVSHSPGYPLFCIFGKLFTYLPFGAIAFRVNLMSAFFAALGNTVLYLIICKLIGIINPKADIISKFLPAISASLIFAFSATYWSQGVVAEVYTLWIFVSGIAILTLLKWTQEKADKLLYLFSFIYGLSINTHQLSLLLAPSFFILLLLYEPKLFKDFKKLAIMLCFFLLGFSLCLYAPVRAVSSPAINWNRIHDLKSFLNYLTRSQYGEAKANYNVAYIEFFPAMNLAHIKDLWAVITREFSAIWVICFLGFIPLFVKAKRYLIFFLSIFFIIGIRIWRVIPNTTRGLFIGRVYLLLSFLVVAVFIGMALYFILELTSKVVKKVYALDLGSRNRLARLAADGLFYLTAVIVALLMVLPLKMNYKENDQSRNYVAYDFGRNVLDTLDKDAIFLGHGDNTLFILAYLQICEKLRPDVTVYDDIGGDVFKNTPFSLFELDSAQQEEVVEFLLRETKRPIYIGFGHIINHTLKHRKRLVGLVYKVLREKETLPENLSEKYWYSYRLNDIFDNKLENKDYLTRELIAVYHLILGTHLMSKDQFAGLSLYRKAAQIDENDKLTQETLAMSYSVLGMHSEAISCAKNSIRIAPNEPEAYFNLGVAYAKAEKYNDAISAWNVALKKNPGYLNAKEYISKAKERVNTASHITPIKDKKDVNKVIKAIKDSSGFNPKIQENKSAK